MLVTMGNNNGPRETINEFPSGSAPNEIEINDITSCTDKQYVTLVDGDGVQSVGVNNNLSFTEDTLCSPKINAGTIESEVIKSSIKTATETMPVSLASADSINYADEENLTYNPETRTLNSVNASFTNVDTNSLSVENMSFDGLCANTFCADVANIETANINNFAWKKACYYVEDVPYESDIYEMNVGPITSICIPAGLSITGTDCNYLAISKYFFPLVECTGIERNRPIISNGFLCISQQSDEFIKIDGVKSGLEHGQYIIFQSNNNNRITMGTGTNNVYFRKDFIFSGIFKE